MTGPSACCWTVVRRLFVLVVVLAEPLRGAAATPPPPRGALMRLDQLQAFEGGGPGLTHAVRLEGTIWWVNPAQQRLVLRDESGAALLEMQWQGGRVQVGQRVRVTGDGTIRRSRTGYRIGARGPVVDNDGTHAMVEKSGTVYLRAGLQPFRLDWFNGAERHGLELDYEGPGLARRPIPATTFRRAAGGLSSGSGDAASGLVFRCYEGVWQALPDFGQIQPVKAGVVPYLDAGVRSREENVAVQFEGFLEVPREGGYTFHLRSDDGSRLYVGGPTLDMDVVGEAALPRPERVTVGQVLRAEEEGRWVQVEGTVLRVRAEPGGLALELAAGAGRMQVQLAEQGEFPPAGLVGCRVRAEGFCEGMWDLDGQRTAGLLWVPGRERLWVLETPLAGAVPEGVALGSKTSAREVHRLKREEAAERRSVRLRGVVTSVLPEDQAFTIQDATRGLYVVDDSPNRAAPPEIGESLEVEGVTDPGLFAPMVRAYRVRSLGAGQLPEPVRPTWEQLMNGSLDAQYVELACILTGSDSNRFSLLTAGGLVTAELRLRSGGTAGLTRHENALIRVRGCLFALWDYVTHQVRAGEFRIYDADLAVDEPAPADVFSSPEKTTAELRLFDPQAGPFQRVRVSGVVVHAQPPEYFVMDEQSGLRLVTKAAAALEPGDRMEAVGFPDLWAGAAPVLREAVVRRIGRAALPEPRVLDPGELVRADLDATRVRVEGILVGVKRGRTSCVFEVQSGLRTFAARLGTGVGAEDVPSPPRGSRLELTGTYAGQGAGRELGAFELLLLSGADIRVLARPPWWTLKRLLVTLGMLGCGLAASALWIAQLRRRVEERTVQLETQIRERQQVEHQRALAQERARIAQDLHDELGSGITEISMLAARARTTSALGETRGRYLEQAGDKAREMVTALDEIVWAMNPRHDTLASLVSYCCLYADRFLGLANVTWRFEGPPGSLEHVVDSRMRHELFLVFKEALTNVVRHAQATEVILRIEWEADELRMSILDNGRGLATGAIAAGMDGLANMRTRIERLGGRFHLGGAPGRGTVVRVCVPTIRPL